MIMFSKLNSCENFFYDTTALGNLNKPSIFFVLFQGLFNTDLSSKVYTSLEGEKTSRSMAKP